MIRKVALSVLVVVALIVLLLFGLATPPGRSLVAGLIERAASTGGLVVAIDGPRGWPPFSFGADRIAVADPDGSFAEINGLDVDVSLTGLVTGTLAFDSVVADRVAIERAPHLPAAGGGDGALLAVAAERFAIGRLELGPALAGRPAALTIGGAFSSDRGGGLDGTMSAQRVDGVRGIYEARVSRADGRAPFAAEIDISEAADGVLVGLIGRDSGPAYALSATVAPDGEAMSGVVALASDGEARFDGAFTLAPADAAGRVTVTGSGDLGELVPADYAALLSGAIAVDVDASWTASERRALPELSIRRGSFSTATVDAQVSGTLSETVADLSLSIDAADPSGSAIRLPMIAGAPEIDRVSLRGSIAPAEGVVRLDLTGNVAGLRLDRYSIPAAGLSLAAETETETGDPFAGNRFPFALRVEADAFRAPGGEIVASATEPLLLTADGTFDADAGAAEVTADLQAAGGSADFTGTVAAGAVTGRLQAAVTEVARLAALAGRDLSGGVHGSLEGTFAGPSGMDLAIAADLVDFDFGNPAAARLLGDSAAVTAHVARDPAGVLTVSELALEGGALSLAGAATIGGDTIEASVSGDIADLAVLAEASAGTATFTAAIGGSMARPTVNATVRVDDGSLLDQPIDNAVIDIAGRPADDGWQAALTLEGSLSGKPLSGTADAVRDGGSGRLAFPAIDLTIADNRVVGSLEATVEGPLDGALQVEAPNLRELAALALTEASGSAEARLVFTPDGTSQRIDVTFSGSDLVYQAFSATTAEGDIRIDDAFTAPHVSGDASARTARAGSVAIDGLSASATVEGGETVFRLAGRGTDFDLAGAGVWTPSQRTLRIDTASGTVRDRPVRLSVPATLELGDGGAAISGARLALGDGTVAVDGTVSPTLDLTVVVTGVPAAVVNSFVPDLSAAGTVSGRAGVTGSLEAPAVAWRLDWSGFSVAQTRAAGLPALQLSAGGDASRDRTTIDGRLSGAGLAVAFAGNAPFAGSGLAIRVQGDAPLALLALRSERELGLAGTARVDVNVQGSTVSPEISGTIALADGTVVDAETGLGIAGATGRIVIDGSRAATEQISGRLSQGGRITVAGSIDFSRAGLPSDLTVRVQDGRYAGSQVVAASFDADLALTGPILGDGTLSGTVALGRTEIQLSDTLGGAATAIDVQHVNTPPGFVPPAPRPRPAAGRASGGGGDGGLRLAVDVTNSGGVFVRGMGVDSEFTGALDLANTIADPRAVGALTMRWGRIEFLGRRFTFDRGTLTFAGDIVPFVDMTATTATADATVSLNVVGPADDPAITFTSTSGLPEEEVLSRLLFDRSVSGLSPLQAAQLVDAAAQLTGVAGGGGFFSRVRQATGLDDLDIRQTPSGGTTVGIARQVSDNLRLGVEAGSGEGRVTVDLDITENLKARGEAGQDGGSIGLTYEREY